MPRQLKKRRGGEISRNSGGRISKKSTTSNLHEFLADNTSQPENENLVHEESDQAPLVDTVEQVVEKPVKIFNPVRTKNLQQKK